MNIFLAINTKPLLLTEFRRYIKRGVYPFRVLFPRVVKGFVGTGLLRVFANPFVCSLDQYFAFMWVLLTALFIDLIPVFIPGLPLTLIHLLPVSCHPLFSLLVNLFPVRAFITASTFSFLRRFFGELKTVGFISTRPAYRPVGSVTIPSSIVGKLAYGLVVVTDATCPGFLWMEARGIALLYRIHSYLTLDSAGAATQPIGSIICPSAKVQDCQRGKLLTGKVFRSFGYWGIIALSHYATPISELIRGVTCVPSRVTPCPIYLNYIPKSINSSDIFHYIGRPLAVELER
jgi:hypothetical protein